MIKAGIDWGSSSFRAYRFNECVEIIATVDASIGIKFVQDNDFEKTLFDQIGGWFESGDSVLLSGMITSRNGWIESPYVECPANLMHMLYHAVRKTIQGVELIFLPGLCQKHSHPDVMRGEELQLLGVTSDADTQLVVMPGTHSKWARVAANEVMEFRTIPTGELFEILRKHSLVGAFASEGAWIEEAFLRGVTIGYESDTIITQLFTCRSSVLLEQLSKDDAYSFMSGMLIGNEIREGQQLMPVNQTICTLVGNSSLCQRYESAFNHLGWQTINAQTDAAARGFTTLINRIMVLRAAGIFS